MSDFSTPVDYGRNPRSKYPRTLAGDLPALDRSQVDAFRARREEDQRLIDRGAETGSTADVLIGSAELLRTESDRVAMVLAWLDSIEVPHEYALPGESHAEYDPYQGAVRLHLRIRIGDNRIEATCRWSLDELYHTDKRFWATHLARFLASWRQEIQSMRSPEGIPL